jgi:hypothetical protein
MMNDNIKRTTEWLEQSFSVIYYLNFTFHSIFHIGVPILFLSIFADFMTNTTEFFKNETYGELGLERSMYFIILLNSISLGVVEIFFLAIKDMNSRLIIVNGSAMYSCIISFFYLIFYYSYSYEEDIHIYYLQSLGFMEIIALIFWFMLIVIKCIHYTYTRKKSLFSETNIYFNENVIMEE